MHVNEHMSLTASQRSYTICQIPLWEQAYESGVIQFIRPLAFSVSGRESFRGLAIERQPGNARRGTPERRTGVE